MKKVLIVMLNPCVDNMIEFDDFIIYKTNRATAEHSCLGGKGLNVARVVRSFGLDTTLTGFIGSDKASELKKACDDAGIKNDFVTVEQNTRTNLKLLNKKNMSVTEVNGISFNILENELLDLSKKIDELLPLCDIAVITGSLPKGVAPGYYAELVKKANSLGKKTVVDASGEALKFALSEKPYAIKPNIDELSEYLNIPLGGIDDISKHIPNLLESGISIAIVSMGADGAVFADRTGTVFAENADIEVKSAVGAGDSVVAATVFAIAQEAGLFELARLGVAAGNMTTTKTGTNLCSADEVLSLKDSIVIHEI